MLFQRRLFLGNDFVDQLLFSWGSTGERGNLAGRGAFALFKGVRGVSCRGSFLARFCRLLFVWR